MSLEAFTWQPDPDSPAINIDPRPDFDPQIAEIGESYQTIHHDVVELIRTGKSDKFIPLPLDQQMIAPEFRASRKLYVEHPDFPEQIFVIGGIGEIRLEDNDTLTLKPADHTTTMHKALGLDEKTMATIHIKSNGDSETILNRDPLGGYTPESAKSKFDKTKQVAEEKLYGNDIEICENVCWGTNGEHLGFYVYTLPKSIETIAQVADRSQHGDPAYAEYYQIVWQSMSALASLQSNQFVSRQHHPGNLFRNTQTGKLIITDFETLQDVSRHRTKKRRKELISPLGHARWNDTEKAMQALTRMFPNPDVINPSEFQYKAFIYAMAGYKKAEVDKKFEHGMINILNSNVQGGFLANGLFPGGPVTPEQMLAILYTAKSRSVQQLYAKWFPEYF